MFFVFLFNIPLGFAFELISHKGVHHEECLDLGFECRASCLTWDSHNYIENTIPAFLKAFEVGADVVEMDLLLSSDNEIVVFHDRLLKCRTDQNYAVRGLTVAQLKKLDLGFNLRFINKVGYPLRGKGAGLLSTLSEVLDALPGKKIFINPKDSSPAFLNRLNEILYLYTVKKKTHYIKDFSMWGPWAVWKGIKDKFPAFDKRFVNAHAGNNCENTWRMFAWSGYFPEHCKNINMVFSEDRINTWHTWGWPTVLLKRFHENGSKVYIIHVKTKDSLQRYKAMGFDGVITSRLLDLVK